MQNLKILITLVFALSLIISELSAQESIPTSGGNGTGSGGVTSYTIGQTVYTTNKGSNGSVAQGVQQPYEISVVSGIDIDFIQLDFLAYPNPTSNYLNLKVENNETVDLFFQLFDINGKLLKHGEISENEITISMIKYTASVYFLKVYSDQKEIKTFKIIKN